MPRPRPAETATPPPPETAATRPSPPTAATPPMEAYRCRIEELRGYGAEEGVAVNPASETDFWAFIEAHPDWRKGLTELMGNGNLRAVWKDRANGRHLGLQFLGRQAVEYVIFQPGPASGEVFRAAGIDDFAGLNRRINDSGLLPLVRQ